MDLHNADLIGQGTVEYDLESCAREIFFESLRKLNRFSLDDLGKTHIDDISE